jgi:surface carbohydrate biosynthesis protein (TIGR04326 family)
MSTLLVFDGQADPAVLAAAGLDSGGAALFPLTGDLGQVSAVRQALAPAELLDSAALVDAEVSAVREALPAWAERLGSLPVFGRTLRERLLLPGHRASSWWYGPLAEKNTFKTDAFLRLAQLRAIRKIVRAKSIQEVAACLGDRRMAACLGRLAAEESCAFRLLPLSPASDRAAGLRGFLERSGVLGHLAAGLAVLGRFLIQGFQVRRGLPPLSGRAPRNGDVLIASYFPAVDPKAAESGRLVNRYWPALPEAVARWGRGLSWLMLPVTLGGRTLDESVALAAKLARGGERLCLIQEFFTPTAFLQALALWLRQIPLAAVAYAAARRMVREAPFEPVAAPLFRELWLDSLAGKTAAEGIAYHLAFATLLERQEKPADIVFPMEMHAWEKALCAAARAATPAPRTIGFQHAALSRNYFHFFSHPRETEPSDRPDALPLPSRLALTGRAVEELLAPCGYPGLAPVEAIRFLAVGRTLEGERPAPPAHPALLVAGSIDPAEVRALTALALAAFPRTEEVDLLFKGHPMCPFEPVFKALGVDPAAAGYKILGGNIGEALARAGAVLVPSSTVSIEALAFGCAVFVPVFPDSLVMNPLADYPEHCARVSTPQALREGVLSALARRPESSPKSQTAFIRHYWRLDPELPLWHDLLSGQGDAKP